MTAHTVTTRAFLLRSVDYGESDRILTLLTLEMGKISALARGARKSHKRFGGSLEPFALFEVAVELKKRGLWNVTEASLLCAHAGLASDLNRFQAAAFAIELVREITAEHQPDHALFALVEETLGLLSRAGPAEVARLAIAAELSILALSGMAVSAGRCNACGRPVPAGRRAHFHPARGGVVCTACGGGPMTLSARATAALGLLSEPPLSRAVEVDIDAESLREIESALELFTDHHLGRPLKTRLSFGR